MTFSFLWFAVGLAVGVNVALAGLWWSLRRENRKAARPIGISPPNMSVSFGPAMSKAEREELLREWTKRW